MVASIVTNTFRTMCKVASVCDYKYFYNFFFRLLTQSLGHRAKLVQLCVPFSYAYCFNAFCVSVWSLLGSLFIWGYSFMFRWLKSLSIIYLQTVSLCEQLNSIRLFQHFFSFFFFEEEQAFKYFGSAVMDMCEEMELPYLNSKTYYWDFQTFESVFSTFCAFAALKCC